jgi:glycosyltransferase involved in cell wall biosynthesis
MRPVVAGGRLVKSLALARPVARVALLARRWNAAVLHTNTSTALHGGLAARVLGRPHVWHIRELVGAGAPFRFPPSDAVAARVFRALSDRLVANSDESAAFFRRHLGPGSIHVIPNGVPEPDHDPAEAGQVLRARLGIPPGARVVGMVASLGSHVKNHAFFLDGALPVAADRPDVHVVLFGDAPPTPYVDGIRAKIGAHPAHARVHLAGHVDDVWAIMGAIDVLGHGTARESFGRVFVEAMLAGKPVIAPRGGGALAIVADGTTGFLVDPDQPADLARRLGMLLDDDAARHRMGAAGRARARDRFSMAAYTAGLAGLYDQLLYGEAPTAA